MKALTASFSSSKLEYAWSLDEIEATLPGDWSPYEFLMLEFRASSSQRFDLAIEAGDGSRIAKRIHPFANAWVRASIPLRFYRQPARDGHDLAATFNHPRGSYWINIHTNDYGPLDDVRAIGVRMIDPVGEPTIEIRSVALAKDDPGDEVLEREPLIDELGQYTRVDWSGKVASLDQLRSVWKAEDESLRAELPGRCSFGGFIDGPTQRATGFFRVERVDGRWWFVCPHGHLFWSTGVNGVRVHPERRIEGRERLFAAIPPEPERTFYAWNVRRRFGDDRWRTKWAELTTRRLRAWGFNTVHNWGAPSETDPEPAVPYAMMLRGWQSGLSVMGMADVYAEDFAERVEVMARQQLEPRHDDPNMFGYFIGNEPPWPGPESLLCDAILKLPAETPTQKRLKSHLAKRDTPARHKAFAMEAFQLYLDTINAAVRKYAPNHLNLGIRFGGDVSDELVKASHGFDVFSLNVYKTAPPREVLDRISELSQRPLLIGEFHIGCPERGLASGLVQAANQEERAAGYRYYVEQCAAHSAVIGAHWFQWIDQPATGRFDGENYNIGFVDVTDQPYAELVAGARLTHSRLLEVHSGRASPSARPHPARSDAP